MSLRMAFVLQPTRQSSSQRRWRRRWCRSTACSVPSPSRGRCKWRRSRPWSGVLPAPPRNGRLFERKGNVCGRGISRSEQRSKQQQRREHQRP